MQKCMLNIKTSIAQRANPKLATNIDTDANRH